MRVYVITYAQDKTRVHDGFLAAIRQHQKYTGSTLEVIAGRYRNPTSPDQADEAEWWDPKIADELMGHWRPGKATKPHEQAPETLKNVRRKLCRNLTVYGDIPIQPTAGNPLSGFEGFLGSSSGIFGHPKRALQTVATATRTPRVMWTTGSVTVANYSDSKAGKKGAHHHVLGACVVEVDDDGVFFVRHITARKDGSFTDLDYRYTKDGRKRVTAAAMNIGDVHWDRLHEESMGACEHMHKRLKPRVTYLHDFLDFRARNHHATSPEQIYDLKDEEVEEELKRAAGGIRRFAAWGGLWKIVRSNHDVAFEKWLADKRNSEDPLNRGYWCEVNGRRHRHRKVTGKWPMAFELEARRNGVPENVEFLRRNQSSMIHDVENGFHTDKGTNGSRGSRNAYIKLGCKVTGGHTHVPWAQDGYMSVGLGPCDLDHGYNDLPSGWARANVVLHEDGKRQVVFIWKGRYRGGMV